MSGDDAFSPFLGGQPVNRPDNEPMLSGALYGSWSLLRLIDRMNAPQQQLFACDCVERVIRHYDARLIGDSQLHRALDITRRYLEGEASSREVLKQQTVVARIARRNSGAGTRPMPRVLWSAATLMVVVMNGALNITPPWEVAHTAAGIAVRLTDNALEREWQRRRAIRILRKPLR